MFAPSVDSLNGAGAQYGGSVAVGATVGAEYVNSFQESGQVYHGFNISGGIGAAVPIDMHGEATKTFTLFEINVFTEIDKLYTKILDW